MPRVTIKTTGKVIPKKGVRVWIGKLPYQIVDADEPTMIDDFTCVTEVYIVPGAAGKHDGSPLIKAELVGQKEVIYEPV